MLTVIGYLVWGVLCFGAGFLVCRNNYSWVKNVEQNAIDKAKEAVNKL